MKSGHKPVLIVIAGPNGSGKTTITSEILKHKWRNDAVYVNPDQIAQDRFGDWNSTDSILKAVQYCEQLREHCIENKKNLIFETVMSSDAKIDFIKKAKDAGYFIRLFFVSTNSPTINAARIARRVMEGGHDVPIQKVISRYYRSLTNCLVVSSFTDRTYVYDNSIDNVAAKLLFRLVDGRLFKQYSEEIPSWAWPIYKQALQSH